MRLIDADAFEKWAWSNPDVVVDGDGYVLPYAASNFAEEHTIDAVPVVHGQWVQKDSRNPFSWRTCSECGYAVTAAQARVYKGCPKCLARMDGDGNE